MIQSSKRAGTAAEWNRVKWDWASLTKGPLSHSSLLSFSEWGKRSRARVDRSHWSPSPSLSSLYSLAKRLWWHHRSHRSPLCSPHPQRPGVATEWSGRQKERKTKFGSVSVTSPHLLGYRGRINSFSLTCLPPCKRVGIAPGASECSIESVGGWYLSFFHTHTHIYFTWHISSLSV